MLAFVTGSLWIVLKLVNIWFIPWFIIRKFRKHEPIPPIENHILMESASHLAEKIRNKQITSEQVIKSYISRITKVNPILNAVIDDRFEEAIEEAKEIDKLITNTPNPQELQEKYPLLGLPITIKGSISIAGLRNSSGMVSRVTPEAVDANLVAKAKEAGAIPLVTSNVPELCLNWETSNKLIGHTKNPYNTTRITGGSSGGEAALLGSAGSLIGIGSDIAGSLRLPAHFCGVFAHKPSPGAVSLIGHYPSCKHQDIWQKVFTLGPMARYAPDLRLLLKVLTKTSVKNSLQLDKPVDFKELKVCYLEDMELLLGDKCNSNMIGGVRKVVAHFDKICNTKCQKVKIPLLKYSSELSNVKLIGIEEVDNLFPGKGEGSIMELFRLITCRSQSMFTSIIYGLIKRFDFLISKQTVAEVDASIETLKQDFQNLLGTNGVLILPTFTREAPYPGDCIRKFLDAGCLSIFNVLGLPVTSCPVTMTKEGLPVGIQVVANPFCDRLTLSVAEEIERATGGWKPPTNAKI